MQQPPSNLTQDDQMQIRQVVEEEQAKLRDVPLVHRVTKSCFDTCLKADLEFTDTGYVEGSTISDEQARCVQNCALRMVDTYLFVSQRNSS